MHALLTLLPLALTPVTDTPPIFTDVSFEEGVENAKAQGKVFVLDAMTSWCGPCKVMDKTTWVEPKLVEWMKDNTIAVQLDMDEHTQVKDGLGINAFPTIVAFKDGREFDRLVGLHDAEYMLGWLSGIKAGSTNLDKVMSEVDAIRKLNAAEVNCEARAQLAGQLLAYGKHDDALAEFTWLWNNIPDHAPLLNEYRWTTLAMRMKSLAGVHEASRVAFESNRDQLTLEAQELRRPELIKIRDWIELNSILDDDGLTVAWAEKMTEHGNGVRIMRGFERRLFPMLVEAGKWRVAGMTLSNPVRRMTEQGQSLGAYDIGAPKTGGMMPAIPMTGGGMKPAKPVEEEPAKEKPEADDKPKTMPAIPLSGGGMKPATRRPQTPEEVAKEVRARLTWHYKKDAGEIYAALLACGRKGEAGQVAQTLLKFVDAPDARASLVAHAFRAGQFEANRDQHLAWLEEAWQK